MNSILCKLIFYHFSLTRLIHSIKHVIASIYLFIFWKTDASGGMELEIPTPGTPSTELQINVISTHVENPPDCNFHTIILDCSSWGFVDTMGVKVLISVSKLYRFIR